MTELRELGDRFPGNWKDKKAVKLELKSNQITVYFKDGSETTLKEPVQIQDFPVPNELIEPWYKMLRDEDSSIERYVFRERSYLQSVLDRVHAEVG